MGDFIPFLLKEKKKVNAYSTDAFWYDVGSIERYERLDNDIVKKELDHLLL
jgi:mannose-1-phosphate guanylyltransferase